MLTIPIDTAARQPLYEQIYVYIKNEIKNGSLAFHTKLPSQRSLAANLSVSRNTVDMAYSQLLSEGYIESYPKKGFFINEITSLHQLEKSNASAKITSHQEKVSPFLYNFSPFSVDLSHFPYHTWQQLSKNCLQDDKELFLLGNNQGDLPLRQAIARYLHQSRGVMCEENQIIIGAGIDYLLQMLFHLFGSNHKIAMENPAYQRANRIFNGFGIKTVPISLDRYGMSINFLEKSGCDIAYVTPSHQYPLGIVMPIKRRIDLLNWANAFDGRFIIEDDHDSEFRYKGKPIPCLQGIASNDNVIYTGTFSRAIAPAIRVAYMVLPQRLLPLYSSRFSYYACTVSRIDQAILTEFINQGYFERHLNRMRKVYKSKHDILISCLKAGNLPIAISGENAGMHLVVQIKNGQPEESLLNQASANRIKLYGLKEHFIKVPDDYIPTYLFGYANLSEEDIKAGCQLLISRCL